MRLMAQMDKPQEDTFQAFLCTMLIHTICEVDWLVLVFDQFLPLG